MIEDLKKYLHNHRDKNQQIVDVLDEKEKITEWYAGGQLDALKYYLSDEVQIISNATDGSYQGTYYAILFVDGKYFLWRDSFGSCSYSVKIFTHDAIDGLNEEKGYDYIIDTMTSVKEFNTLNELWKYLEKSDDYLLGDLEINLIEELKKNMKKKTK